MSKTIHSFSINNESAAEAQWVLGGTNGDLHQSFVFIEIEENSKEVTLSNNKYDGLRMIRLTNNLNNNTASKTVKLAVRAKIIAPLIPKPTSDDSLDFSIIEEDDGSMKCMISRDSRSVSVRDMSDLVFDTRRNTSIEGFDKTFTVDFSEFFVWVKYASQAVGSEGEFELHSSNSESAPMLTMRSGTPDIISQVVISGEQNGNTEDSTSIVSSKSLSGTKNFTKMVGGLDTITGYTSQGSIAFKAASKEKDALVDSLIHIIPTSLNGAPIDINPFDSERKDILVTDDIAFVKEQVSSISSIASTTGSSLRIDTTQNGVVKLQVTDREGTAKSVSFDYVIQDNTTDVSVPLESFKSALKGFEKDDVIQISQAKDEQGNNWIIISDQKGDSDNEEDVDVNEDVNFITNEIAVKCI